MRRNGKQLQNLVRQACTKKDRAIAYYELGLFHDNNGREPEAIPNYRMALRLGLEKKLKSQALAWLASSLYKTGKPNEALKKVADSQKIVNKRLQNFLRLLESKIRKSMQS